MWRQIENLKHYRKALTIRLYWYQIWWGSNKNDGDPHASLGPPPRFQCKLWPYSSMAFARWCSIQWATATDCSCKLAGKHTAGECPVLPKDAWLSEVLEFQFFWSALSLHCLYCISTLNKLTSPLPSCIVRCTCQYWSVHNVADHISEI